MSLTTYIQDPRTQVTFKSTWVHLVIQVAAAYLMLGPEIMLLLVFITQFPGILYFAFQFPITGLLIRQSQDITTQKVAPHEILKRFLISSFLFTAFASGVALLILVSGSLLNLQADQSASEAILTNFSLIFKYFAPVLFTGELIRQRLYFKKIYGQNA